MTSRCAATTLSRCATAVTEAGQAIQILKRLLRGIRHPERDLFSQRRP
jgi:hypothetical protein